MLLVKEAGKVFDRKLIVLQELLTMELLTPGLSLVGGRDKGTFAQQVSPLWGSRTTE